MAFSANFCQGSKQRLPNAISNPQKNTVNNCFPILPIPRFCLTPKVSGHKNSKANQDTNTSYSQLPSLFSKKTNKL